MTNPQPPSTTTVDRLLSQLLTKQLSNRYGDAMKAVNVLDAKTHFSELLARAERGEEVIVARAGRPVAKLVALGDLPPRILGKGFAGLQVDLSDSSFFAALPNEELDAWEGADDREAIG
jgi:prevent-host-death family protein